MRGKQGAYVKTKSIPTISGSRLPIHIVELSGKVLEVYPDPVEPDNGGVMSCGGLAARVPSVRTSSPNAVAT